MDVTPIVPKEKGYMLAYSKMSQMIRRVEIPSKTSVSDEHLNFMASEIAYDNQQNIADLMTENFRFYASTKSVTDIADKYSSSYLSGVYLQAYNDIYKNTIDKILQNMSRNETINMVRKQLKLIFWENLEIYLSGVKREQYLSMTWNLGESLVSKNVFPKIMYPKLDNFNNRNNDENTMLQYKYIPTDFFMKFQEPVFYFINADESQQVVFSDESIGYDQYKDELNKIAPKFLLQLKNSKNYIPITHDEIDNTIADLCNRLKSYFPDKTELQLKSELASIIYSQSDIRQVYKDRFNMGSNGSRERERSKNIQYPDLGLPQFPDYDINKALD